MTEDDMNAIVTMIEAVETRLVATIKATLNETPQWLNLSKQLTELEGKATALEEENRQLRERHVVCEKYIPEGADLLAVIGADEVPADAARRLIKERAEAVAEAKWLKKDRDSARQLASDVLNQRDEARTRCRDLETRCRDLEKALKPLAYIADRYDDNELDECRPEWKHSNDANVELYSGRGGKELLYLRDALEARSVLRGGK